MPRLVTIAFGFALALHVAAQRARADAADEVPLLVRYRAPATCPGSDAFLSEVTARTPRARAAHAGEAATSVRIAIRDVPGGNAGTLELTAPGTAPSLREVSASDCGQVVAALALMTALAIDPNAALGVVQHEQPQPAAPKPQPALRIALPETPSTRDAVQWSFSLGVQLTVAGGLAPDLLLLPRPFVQLAREDGSGWGQALRVSATHAYARIESTDGNGSLSLWLARLELCPLRVFPIRSLALSACVPVDAGRLSANGRAVTPSKQVARPWLSLGTAGRVEWEVFEMWVLEAAGELSVPVVRDRFYVGTGTTLHRAPAVAGAGSLGIGVRFP